MRSRKDGGFRAGNRLAAVAGVLKASVAALLLLSCARVSEAQNAPISLWQEGAANCTWRLSDDGHVHYTINYQNMEITLAVDRQELEKVKHREIPVIGVFISFRYKSGPPIEVGGDSVALQFLKHRKTWQPALDPDGMLRALQADMDAVSDEIERHKVRRHPEQKDALESELRQRLKDYTELMDFVSTRSLRDATLDGGNPSAEGWVFFSTQNRWIGALHRPEEFLLKIPLDSVTVEFPFELPPRMGKPELRRRPAE